MNDQHDLTVILRSRFPIVAIETHEEARVIALLEPSPTSKSTRFSSLYEAHARGTELATELMLEEIGRTRPLSVVARERIEALRAWAKERAVFAND